MSTAQTLYGKITTAGTIHCLTCICCMAICQHGKCGMWVCGGCWFDHEGMGCEKVAKETA